MSRNNATSFDVAKAILNYWEPGRFADWSEEIQNAPPGGPYRRENTAMRAEWEKWARRNRDVMYLAMIAVSQNCTVVNPDQAMSFMAVSTIAFIIRRDVRYTQRILRQMEKAYEIIHTPCDGTCGKIGHTTDHWIIPRPPDADPWGEPRKPRGRPRTRGGGA